MAQKASDTDFRRKWDANEFAERAKKRKLEEEEANAPKKSNEPVKRELLKQRDFKVDLDSHVGKIQVVTNDTPMAQQGGFYCDVCDCVLKDSINFLDHINGRKHQKNLGMSMKVERSTVDQVKGRLSMIKKKQEEKERVEEFDFEARLEAAKKEEERRKKAKKDRQKEKKAAANGGSSELTPEEEEMQRLMGFSGFSSKN